VYERVCVCVCVCACVERVGLRRLTSGVRERERMCVCVTGRKHYVEYEFGEPSCDDKWL
jgi:hypothetical protein